MYAFKGKSKDILQESTVQALRTTRFGAYETNHSGGKVECFIQLLLHKREKQATLLIHDQGWRRQAALNGISDNNPKHVVMC